MLTAGKPHVSRYLQGLTTQGLKPSSRARRMSSLRQLYKFLEAEGLVAESPVTGQPAPGKSRSLPKTLSVAEVDRLIETAAQATEGLSGRDLVRAVRHHCLVEILYATGMRVSELVSLPRAVLHGDPRVFTIKGKGGRERLVPLNTSARRALDRYLGLGSTPADGVAPMVATRYLFPSRGAEGHLTRQRFAQDIKATAIAAGLDPERVSPHVLRHAFASHLLDRGRGSSRRAKPARSCRHLDDRDLHARARRAAKEDRRRSSPALEADLSLVAGRQFRGLTPNSSHATGRGKRISTRKPGSLSPS